MGDIDGVRMLGSAGSNLGLDAQIVMAGMDAWNYDNVVLCFPSLRNTSLFNTRSSAQSRRPKSPGLARYPELMKRVVQMITMVLTGGVGLHFHR